MSEPEQNYETVPERWTKATESEDMWVDPDDDPREGGQARGERDTVLEYLRQYRLTLRMKCEGLDAEQLARQSVPPSTMTLLGLLRHAVEVERHWFRRELAGEDAPPRYCTPEDRDGDFNGAVDDPAVVADAWAQWEAEVAFSEAYTASHTDLSEPSATRGIPLRDILIHLIEEYARHCGHADLLRERIDGRVGQ